MNQERLMKIILAPHVSEKGTNLADKHHQLIFKVLRDAEKPEIKQALELLFKVKVKSVETACLKGKVKRFKQMLGRRKDWKKAYVTLEKGYDIDFLKGSKEE